MVHFHGTKHISSTCFVQFIPWSWSGIPWNWPKRTTKINKFRFIYAWNDQKMQLEFSEILKLCLMMNGCIWWTTLSILLRHVKAKIFGSHFGSIILFNSMPEINTKKRTERGSSDEKITRTQGYMCNDVSIARCWIASHVGRRRVKLRRYSPTTYWSPRDNQTVAEYTFLAKQQHHWP